MKLPLAPFPIDLTEKLLRTLETEMRAKVERDITAEYEGVPAEDIKCAIDLEVGSGFDSKKAKPFDAGQARAFYAAALLLAEPFHPDTGRDQAPAIRAWLQEAGWTLHRAGGVKLMQDMHHRVKAMLNHAIPLSRAWDGVTDWRH